VRRNSLGLIPASYWLLLEEEQEEVSSLMKIYNANSIGETFSNPETFYNQVLRGPRASTIAVKVVH
jgi:hypothetical protein